MKSLDELIQAAPLADAAEQHASFVIDNEEDHENQLTALVGLFVEDESLDSVRVCVEGETDRLLARTTVLDLIEELDKDVGSSDSFFLPGHNVRSYRVRCGEPLCARPAWFAGGLAIAGRNRCIDHPNAA